MPSYNNSDTYIRKPRSSREARKRRESRVSHGTDKWSDVKQKKRREMKFRTNRRYDKHHIVRSFNDDLDEDVANVVEIRPLRIRIQAPREGHQIGQLPLLLRQPGNHQGASLFSSQHV